MNNTEKLEMLNDACLLLRTAAEKIKTAKKMVKKCGIVFCEGFKEEEIKDWEMYACNLQVFKGIKKLEEITGVKAEHPQNEFATSKEYLKLKYNGFVFLQVGDATKTNFKFM